MSPPEADRIHALDDFANLLAALADDGCSAVVIGGLAVGAYAHLLGESMFSGDLDLYADSSSLNAIARWARQHAIVRKMPQPRNIQVAFIEWEGKEVNVLTSSPGLPDYLAAYRGARIFHPRRMPDLDILVADPYDLLANKLHVNRPKDQPHIDVLRRFIEEEIVVVFGGEGTPRTRSEPARRLLDVLETRVLPEAIAARLLPLARAPFDFRFLMHHVPTSALATALLARIPAEAREAVGDIHARRDFSV